MAANSCCLLTNEQMYAADKAAVAAGVPGVTLMENAGAAIFRAIEERHAPCPVAVLAGPGNNGGDGFVVARYLKEAGWPVRLALLGARDSLKGDAAHHAGLWDGEAEALSPAILQGASLVVDALFGAGLSRPLEGAAAQTVEAANRSGEPLIAVDVPSGISGDDGALVGGLAARAELTVTFFRKKPGHLLLPGRERCGEVVLADIGIPDGVLAEIGPRLWENDPALWAERYPWKRPGDHKYAHGHALIAGGAEMTGAGRLASRAALRCGAGLVTVAAPQAARLSYQLASPSVIVAACDEAAEWDELLADRRRNAVLLGPGGGVGAALRGQVTAALGAGKAAVLDADALTSFAGDREALFGTLGGNCVLTPHEGEFARLFPELQGDKLAQARAAAEISGAVVLLKGADSVIAAPDGRAAINGNAPPELATAGSGDVLAGMILAFLAQGVPAFEAACMAAWLHGEAARLFGPGLISEDIAERLPAALTSLQRLLKSAKNPG
jgi:NAD(P)H-hydrate epimerase